MVRSFRAGSERNDGTVPPESSADPLRTSGCAAVEEFARIVIAGPDAEEDGARGRRCVDLQRATAPNIPFTAAC